MMKSGFDSSVCNRRRVMDALMSFSFIGLAKTSQPSASLDESRCVSESRSFFEVESLWWSLLTACNDSSKLSFFAWRRVCSRFRSSNSVLIFFRADLSCLRVSWTSSLKTLSVRFSALSTSTFPSASILILAILVWSCFSRLFWASIFCCKSAALSSASKSTSALTICRLSCCSFCTSSRASRSWVSSAKISLFLVRSNNSFSRSIRSSCAFVVAKALLRSAKVSFRESHCACFWMKTSSISFFVWFNLLLKTCISWTFLAYFWLISQILLSKAVTSPGLGSEMADWSAKLAIAPIAMSLSRVMLLRLPIRSSYSWLIIDFSGPGSIVEFLKLGLNRIEDFSWTLSRLSSSFVSQMYFMAMGEIMTGGSTPVLASSSFLPLTAPASTARSSFFFSTKYPSFVRRVGSTPVGLIRSSHNSDANSFRCSSVSLIFSPSDRDCSSFNKLFVKCCNFGSIPPLPTQSKCKSLRSNASILDQLRIQPAFFATEIAASSEKRRPGAHLTRLDFTRTTSISSGLVVVFHSISWSFPRPPHDNNWFIILPESSLYSVTNWDIA